MSKYNILLLQKCFLSFLMLTKKNTYEVYIEYKYHISDIQITTRYNFLS